MAAGAAINVRGTLRVEGHPLQQVNITGAAKTRGAWNHIKFEASAVPYNETSGEGSLVANALLEYGGSADGTILVDGASPRIEVRRLLGRPPVLPCSMLHAGPPRAA